MYVYTYICIYVWQCIIIWTCVHVYPVCPTFLALHSGCGCSCSCSFLGRGIVGRASEGEPSERFIVRLESHQLGDEGLDGFFGLLGSFHRSNAVPSELYASRKGL